MTNRQQLNERFRTVFRLLEERGDISRYGRSDSGISAFAEALGTKGHVITNILRGGGRNLTYEQAKTMCSKFKVSEHYMFQGIGKPFDHYLEHAPAPAAAYLDNSSPRVFREGKILYTSLSAVASAGVDTAAREDAQFFSIPGIQGEHVAFTVSGNSMSPTILNGDLVICKEINDVKGIRDNEIYAVAASGSVMIKRVQKVYNRAGELTHLKLISDNYIDHDPFTVELQEVQRILEVTRRVTSLGH